MFAKPFDVGGKTRLKNKDAKALRKRLLAAFPAMSNEDALTLVPNKEPVSLIKLPERSVAYSVGDNPLVIDVQGRGKLVPTVYALWKVPHMVPCFTTHSGVSSALLRGADLMLPGVHESITDLAEITRGQVRSVRLASNPLPFAVGTSALNRGDLAASGGRGVALHVLHVYRDHLWALGDRSKPNVGYKQDIVEADPEFVAAVRAAMQQQQQQQGEQPPVDGDEAQGGDSAAAAGGEDGGGASALDSEESMDDMVLTAFLQALHMLDDGELPMLANVFQTRCLLPARLKGTQINVKATRWKKLSGLLDEMEEDGLITLEEDTPGIISIASVNKEHRLYYGHTVFAPHELEGDGSDSAAAGTGGAAAQSGAVKVCPVWKAVVPVLPLLGAGVKKGRPFTAQELYASVRRYADAHNLMESKKRLRVDDTITQILLRKQQVRPNYGVDQIVKLMCGAMTPAYVLTLPNGDREVRNGAIPTVTIAIERRQGRKRTTTVWGFHGYGIEAAVLAKELRIACAVSTSCDMVPGSANKAPYPTVSAQGNVAAQATQVIVRKGVSEKNIVVEDKTKKSKKKK